MKKEGKSIHKAETNTNQKEELESIAKRWYELSDNLTLYIEKQSGRICTVENRKMGC